MNYHFEPDYEILVVVQSTHPSRFRTLCRFFQRTARRRSPKCCRTDIHTRLVVRKVRIHTPSTKSRYEMDMNTPPIQQDRETSPLHEETPTVISNSTLASTLTKHTPRHVHICGTCRDELFYRTVSCFYWDGRVVRVAFRPKSEMPNCTIKAQVMRSICKLRSKIRSTFMTKLSPD